jgi:hypothetical protein
MAQETQRKRQKKNPPEREAKRNRGEKRKKKKVSSSSLRIGEDFGKDGQHIVCHWGEKLVGPNEVDVGLHVVEFLRL